MSCIFLFLRLIINFLTNLYIVHDVFKSFYTTYTSRKSYLICDMLLKNNLNISPDYLVYTSLKKSHSILNNKNVTQKEYVCFFFIYYTRCPLQLPHSQTFGDDGFNRLFCQYDFLVLWVKCLHEDVKCLHEVVKCIHKGLVTLSLHLIY